MFRIGLLLSDTGRPTEAEAEYRRALAIQGKLAAENPAVTEFRSRLAQSHDGLGWLLMEAGRPSEAVAEFGRALPLLQKLADDDPKAPGYRQDAANVLNNLSIALRRLGRPAEAREQCERAVALREALVKEHPRMPDYRAGLAENLFNRGLARLAEGDPAGAAADLRRATGLYGTMPSLNPEHRYSFAAPAPRCPGWPAGPARGCWSPRRPSRPTRRWPCCTRPSRWATVPAMLASAFFAARLGDSAALAAEHSPDDTTSRRGGPVCDASQIPPRPAELNR